MHAELSVRGGARAFGLGYAGHIGEKTANSQIGFEPGRPSGMSGEAKRP
jgi:hypothetical protein